MALWAHSNTRIGGLATRSVAQARLGGNGQKGYMAVFCLVFSLFGDACQRSNTFFRAGCGTVALWPPQAPGWSEPVSQIPPSRSRWAEYWPQLGLGDPLRGGFPLSQTLLDHYCPPAPPPPPHFFMIIFLRCKIQLYVRKREEKEVFEEIET